MTNKLGINGDSIRYEVALEILGQERQPFMQALREEGAQETPCHALIQFFEARLRALDDLQAALRPTDLGAIEKVLEKEYRLIRV